MAVSIKLTHAERETLERWARGEATVRALILRSQIVLASADGRTNTDLAAELGVSRSMVAKWRSRFADDRLAGLSDEPRSGRPRVLSETKVAEIIKLALVASPPDGDNRWTSRSIAMASGVSQSTVSRTWRAFGLRTAPVEPYDLTVDQQFAEKAWNVVGLYLGPPEKVLAFCVEGKLSPGDPEATGPGTDAVADTSPDPRHNPPRRSISSLFAPSNTVSSLVSENSYRRRRRREFLDFLEVIDCLVPADCSADLVLGAYPVHEREPIKSWLACHPRFRTHFVSTSDSWNNFVDRWFSDLVVGESVEPERGPGIWLEGAVRAWADSWARSPTPFVWTAGSEEFLEAAESLGVIER